LVVVGSQFTGRIAVDKHVTGVPELLRQIDPDLKVFYNMKTHEYEVWGLDKRGPYVLATFERLDHTVVEAIRHGYWMARNDSHPWRRHIERIRERNARRAQEDDRVLSEMFRDDFRWFGRDLWPGWGGKH
jgi:hypothetical protein